MAGDRHNGLIAGLGFRQLRDGMMTQIVKAQACEAGYRAQVLVASLKRTGLPNRYRNVRGAVSRRDCNVFASAIGVPGGDF